MSFHILSLCMDFKARCTPGIYLVHYANIHAYRLLVFNQFHGHQLWQYFQHCNSYCYVYVPYKGAFVVGKDIFVLQGVAVDSQEHFTMPYSLWGAQAGDIHKLDMSLPWTELNLVGLNTLLGNDMNFVGSDQTKLDLYLLNNGMSWSEPDKFIGTYLNI